ncbi:MAG: hypothetical protein KC635_21130, partial [Myxococcales bacterium]|nr:hypothetical protein [Myxococcales bacterium]
MATMSSSRLPWVALLGLLAACSSGEGAAELKLLDASRGVSLLADAVTGTSPGDDADATSVDDTAGPGDGTAPRDVLGETGAVCATGADCASGYCVATADGMQCARLCPETGCDAGETCAEAGDEAAIAYVCVPTRARLCQPCEVHADCSPIPGHEGPWRCVGYGDAGRFCGIPCDAGCPEGYACGGDGQCRKSEGLCECDALAEATGASTECRRTGEAGVCHGERSCSALGLGACSAPEPAPDVCNGVDDDCSGEADDGPAADCGDVYVCGGVQGCLTRCESDDDCATGLVCD